MPKSVTLPFSTILVQSTAPVTVNPRPGSLKVYESESVPPIPEIFQVLPDEDVPA